MGILSTAPWRDANPLLMKIGQQLQQQTAIKQTGLAQQQTAPPSAEELKRMGGAIRADGKEVRHGE
ncbi:MAG TPA: hypothetical protein VGJ20_20655 [Xanthobacteraceae bacterium]